MIDTKARQQLEELLKKHRLSQAALARALDISPVSVNAWLAGRARPESHFRRALFNTFAIDPLAWETEEEKARCAAAVDRMRTAVAA